MENGPFEDDFGIFHCYVSLLEGNYNPCITGYDPIPLMYCKQTRVNGSTGLLNLGTPEP